MNIVLEKYHGLGNDYLVFDPNKNEMELNEENVRLLCLSLIHISEPTRH